MRDIYRDLDEMKLLKKSKLYIDALSQGIDPLSGEFVEDSVISNPKVKNCLEYVAFVLEKVIDKGGLRKHRSKSDKIIFSMEDAERVEYSTEPIGVNEISKRINLVIDKENSKNVSGAYLADLLVEEGFLNYNEAMRKKELNSRSKELGLIEVERENHNTGRSFKQILYGEKAQRFVVQCLAKKCEGKKDI